jgi:hypothetical protein
MHKHTCQKYAHLGLSNDVSPEKKRCSPHLGLGKIDVSCVGDFQGVVTLGVAKA